MALHVPKSQMQSMMKDGAKHFSGMEEAVYRNIEACKQMSNIVRTSFGPNGMNKMIVNHLDKLFVTNDAATIIRELEVEHPAAKILILASQQQEHEVGDGTNFVIVLAGAILAKAEALLQMGLSTAEVIEGIEMAAAHIAKELPDLVCHTVTDIRDVEQVKHGLKAALASKQYGYEDFLAGLVAKACVDVAPKTESRKPFNVDNIRVIKVEGSGVLMSSVTRGMVFPRPVMGTVRNASNCKVAVFTADVDIIHTETKGTVLISNAAELKAFSRGEEDLLEGQLAAIRDSGCTVIVTSGRASDLAMHFLNKFGILVLKLNSKYELRRLCRTVGAVALPRLTPPTQMELGHCDEVRMEEIGDTTVTVFRQKDEASSISTVIIRGATPNVMDDIERAVDDGVNVFKAMTQEQRFVPGAGASEIDLARRVSTYAETCPGLEQYAIQAVADALEVVPRILAENAGVKAQEVVASMYAAHEKGEKNTGFDIEGEGNGGVVLLDAEKKGILDSFKTKKWSIRYAVQAACTVLRVDQIIMAKKAGGPKSKPNPMQQAER